MRILPLLTGAAAALAVASAAHPARADFITTVVGTGPIDFWALNTDNATSLGTSADTSTYLNGVTSIAAPGLAQQANAAGFNGVNNGTPGEITTSLMGSITGSGSIMAWINLAALPSSNGNIFYIAGESQSGNDLDLQMETDNKIKFYTGAGENTAYAPAGAGLTGTWHQVVATYTGGPSGSRNIYWDGALVASDSGSVSNAGKTSVFTIGYSSVWGGREFDGSIADVGVWGTPLTAGQVSAIYDAAGPAAPVNPVPEPASAALFGFAALAMLGLRRRA